MARYAQNGTARDGMGVIISGATVVVYEADTTTPATIYAAKSGGSAVSGASLTTGTDGTFLFYVDDGDYPSGAQFDITATKGILSNSLYDVMVF